MENKRFDAATTQTDGAHREDMASLRSLRISVISMLVFLTVQGWTGDFANLFVVFPSGSVSLSMDGFLQALNGAGIIVEYHAFEGTLLLAISVLVLILSFRASSSSTLVRVFAFLGLGATVSAATGGILFVLSGFLNNANSAQMGGSFIGAYAFYFLTLYYTKK